MIAHKEPTTVSLVYAVLFNSGDFRTAQQLVEETRQSPNRVSAALFSLFHYKAVAAMPVPVPGFSRPALYWYATPDTDTRSRTVEMRAPEKKGRARKPRINKLNKGE